MAQKGPYPEDLIKVYKPYFSPCPSYFEEFKNLISKVIYKDDENSFSLQYKLFYGLIASLSIGVGELAEDFEIKFKLCGGDDIWIKEGIKCENIPKHIKGFAKINDILVHKPWIIHWAHFSEFDSGLTYFLFQSAIIVTTVHRFATIISALNIVMNKDIKENKIDKTKYILNPIEYVDFNKNHSDKFLYIDDFDWKTNAKYFFSDYAEKEMDILEKDLKFLDSLSDNVTDDNNIFSKENVIAIEKYVEIILGIKDREYNYHNVNTNKFLNKYRKTLIKDVACFPEKLCEKKLDQIKLILESDDFIRLVILVTAIKQKICLTHFAKAFDEFSSNKKKNDINSEE